MKGDKTVAYEKPQLIVLNFARAAVRDIGQDVGSQETGDGKLSTYPEDRQPADISGTSSSGGAYEADE